MTTQTNEQLIQEVFDRVKAMPNPMTEADIRRIVREHFDSLLEDETFTRKFKFGGGQAEQKLIGSKFGRWQMSVADIEFLYDLQVSLKGQRRVDGTGYYTGPSEALTEAFKHISEAYYMSNDEIRQIDRRAIDDLFPRIPLAWVSEPDRQILRANGRNKRGWAAFQDTEAYQRSMRAMDTAESGFGSQLVGAQYVPELWAAARLESRVFGLLDSFEMTDPTAYLPIEADLPELLFVPENLTANAADYDTTKTGSQRVQVDAKKFICHQIWSLEIEEDSIIPFIPFLREQATKSLAHYSDSLVLNGDTTGTATGNINLDDAAPAATKHYLAFDALRHVGLVDNTGNSTNQAGAMTFSALINARGTMVDATYLMDWGHPTDPEDLIYVAEPDTGDNIALLDEFITVDKFGPAATVLTGQVGRIGRHPLISSIAMSKTEADGKVSVTGSNNTLGQVLIFNRRGVKVGWRRRVRTETERLPGRDQTRLVHSLRLGFGRYSPTGAAAGLEVAHVIRNITV